MTAVATHLALSIKLRGVTLIDPDRDANGVADDNFGFRMFVGKMNLSGAICTEV